MQKIKINLKKGAMICVFIGLTSTTIGACKWQWNRYNYSLNKWSVLNEEF